MEGGDTMYKTIQFTLNEINKCEEFSKEISWKHPHFRDKNNKARRTKKQVEESVILGKLAEMAVYRLFKGYYKHKKVTQIDFDIYPVGETDEHDISVNDVHISIKSSKPNSSCLLIEKEKFQVNEDGIVVAVDKKTPPDAYVFVHVDVKKHDSYHLWRDLLRAVLEAKTLHAKRDVYESREYETVLVSKTTPHTIIYG
jgi:hypothetical protein